MTENKFSRKVSAVCIKENKVLCIEHVFGKAEKIIDIPCGGVLLGETPWEAVKRIVKDQTNLTVTAKDILGVKFSGNSEYIAYNTLYIDGVEKPDQRVVWIPVQMACLRIEMPELSKKMIKAVLREITIKQLDCDGLLENERLFGIR